MRPATRVPQPKPTSYVSSCTACAFLLFGKNISCPCSAPWSPSFHSRNTVHKVIPKRSGKWARNDLKNGCPISEPAPLGTPRKTMKNHGKPTKNNAKTIEKPSKTIEKGTKHPATVWKTAPQRHAFSLAVRTHSKLFSRLASCGPGCTSGTRGRPTTASGSPGWLSSTKCEGLPLRQPSPNLQPQSDPKRAMSTCFHASSPLLHAFSMRSRHVPWCFFGLRSVSSMPFHAVHGHFPSNFS